jgi:hypothetical protein
LDRLPASPSPEALATSVMDSVTVWAIAALIVGVGSKAAVAGVANW